METISGFYNNTLYRNEFNGYTIFSFVTKKPTEHRTPAGDIICVGILSIYSKGMPLRLIGRFEQSADEHRFVVEGVTESSDEKDTTIAYLSSDCFYGIGEKTAEKIVSITGTDIFAFIKKPNAREILLDNIKEFNSEKVNKFLCSIRNSIHEREVFEYIHQYGGEYVHASKLCAKHKENALKAIKETPYTAGRYCGLRFEICDAIAKSEGFVPLDEKRIEYLVFSSLSKLSGEGNIYATLSDVHNTANKLVKSSAFTAKIPVCVILRAALKMKDVVVEKGDETRFYIADLWRAESAIVTEAKRLQDSAVKFLYKDEFVNEAEKVCGIKYSEKQKRAFDFLKTSGIKILTGGPGTGKTTSINGLIAAYRFMFPSNSILLCAPTGRAAQRMTESTGYPASTIHRALDIKPYGDEIIFRNQSNPIAADFVIVDEMSMADETVVAMLLGAIKNGSLVILSGDIDQLPSVGPGNVLRDMIDSGLFEVDALDVIYRQSNGSDIIENAISVNGGVSELKSGKKFKIIEVESEDEISAYVQKLMMQRLDVRNPFKTQVLTTVKKGAAGTFKLNTAIQNIFNAETSEAGYGPYRYRCGDKIMMTRNNYTVGYLNGDIGIILDIKPDGIDVSIADEKITIPKNCICDMVLSYAITIHKSQGSEYPTVIIALPATPSIMLKRNLLYTAITRASDEVIIVTQPGTIGKAVADVDCYNRKTMLSEKLTGVRYERVARIINF